MDADAQASQPSGAWASQPGVGDPLYPLLLLILVAEGMHAYGGLELCTENVKVIMRFR